LLAEDVQAAKANETQVQQDGSSPGFDSHFGVTFAILPSDLIPPRRLPFRSAVAQSVLLYGGILLILLARGLDSVLAGAVGLGALAASAFSGPAPGATTNKPDRAVQLTSTGLVVRSVSGAVEVPFWSITSVTSDAYGIYARTGPGAAVTVPRRAFAGAEAAEAFERRLSECIATAEWAPSDQPPTFILSAKEIRSGQWIASFPWAFIRIAVMVSVGLVLTVLAGLGVTRYGEWMTMPGAVGAALVLICLTSLGGELDMKRLEAASVALTPEGVGIRHPGLVRLVSWHDIDRIVETSTGLIVVAVRQQGPLAIPMRAFRHPSEAAEFLESLHAGVDGRPIEKSWPPRPGAL